MLLQCQDVVGAAGQLLDLGEARDEDGPVHRPTDIDGDALIQHPLLEEAKGAVVSLNHRRQLLYGRY